MERLINHRDTSRETAWGKEYAHERCLYSFNVLPATLGGFPGILGPRGVEDAKAQVPAEKSARNSKSILVRSIIDLPSPTTPANSIMYHTSGLNYRILLKRASG